MQDYISQIWSNFRKTESQVVSEGKNADELIAELRRIHSDLEENVIKQAEILLNLKPADLKLGDRINPIPAAFSRIRDEIEKAISYIEAMKNDPFKEEDSEEVGADAPSMSEEPDDAGAKLSAEVSPENLEESVENEESNSYYQSIHPDQEQDSLLQINGWNYANGEIWDDQGVCSITYDVDSDKIVVYELLDPDGIEQDQIALCDSIEELDDALTSFVELDSIAAEMKEAFASYIDFQRGNTIEEAAEEPVLGEPPVAQEPTIIDEWEYLAVDPEFNDNQTLLYDKEAFAVFIQKDADPENELPYYVSIAQGTETQEKEFGNIDDLCKWLEVNELPVPTEDAKLAISTAVESINEEKKDDKDCKCKLPDGMKCVEDDPSISTVAPAVKEPEVAEIEEPEKAKKK